MVRPVLFAALLLCVLVPVARAAPESLAADGRVGVVADRQGLVLIRPAGRQRWTPLGQRGLVFPGDRIRTETRGANALDLRLKGGARLTVGPGALLDVKKDGSFELLAGEVEALGTTGAPLVVRGPGGGEVKAESAIVARAKDGKLEVETEAPKWLTGYRANTSDEWMGALLATVDGREVPLAVGYHKVDVEIRDQVARTTIEESFVNATASRLEGVFRFPLPAEASIGGFGMWIGDELVEADVVERERARQIYEDILRRKKDPGLLEWAGGNVFQARVFPIEAKSEKRIRLVYTEVLPLEGATWRYRYALRSELLRAHPLRELQLTVRAVSTAALAEVTCPTHADARVTADAHTALVELSQRDVSPDKDFEVAGRLGATEGLTVVTHRRGDDAWFLLLVQPPDAGSTAWQRDLVPEGPPLDVILALDTSGSIDAAARAATTAFVTALLGQLGPEDRVRALTIDTESRWMAKEAKPADPDTADEVLRFLAARPSLGWTDLDKAFDALAAAAGPKTQVIYVGDGIGTSGDGDPVALAQRIRARSARTRGTFHAVAPAATYEKGVLDAIASLGGGSVRALKEDPAGAATKLLTEAAMPLVKDAKVEVQGLRTARVYPEVLPNLPLGTQHAVLGRFLPNDAGGNGSGKGTVVVTGTLEGKPVRFTAPIAVPGNEEGNSFLPRLWARRHLDALMAQGDAKAVKDDIVRFSTEYGILTPYTSLLVLESDADRETYGVERRVHARDGEAEFAATRDKVSLEVARKAAKEARTWRMNLRRQMLRELAVLGRDLPLPVPETGLVEMVLPQPPTGSGYGFFNDGAWAGSGAGAGADFYEMSTNGMLGARRDSLEMGYAAAAAPSAAAMPESDADMPFDESVGQSADGSERMEFEGEGRRAPGERAQAVPEVAEEAKDSFFKQDDADEEPFAAESPAPEALPALEEWAGDDKRMDNEGMVRKSRRAGTFGYSEGYYGGARPRRPQDHPGSLGFPGAGRPVFDPPLSPEPPVGTEDALALLRRVLGNADETLHLRIETRYESFHPLRQAPLGGPATVLYLRAPERWFVRTAGPGQEPQEQSLGGGVVTSLSTGTRLARAWRAGPYTGWTVADLRRALGYPDARSVAGARVTLAPGADAGTVVLRFDRPPAAFLEEWTVRAADGLLVERRLRWDGETIQRTVFAEAADVGGLAWARRVETYDEQNRLTGRRTATVAALGAEEFDGALGAALRGREDVLTLGPDLPKVADARRSLAQGKAGFAERVVLLLDRLRVERYDEAWAHAEAALGPVKEKPGADWIRLALLARTRRGEDLRKHLEVAMARRIAATPALGWPLAARAYAFTGGLGNAEALKLLAAYEPSWTSGGKDAEARWVFGAMRLARLWATGRPVDARALTAERAAERPFDYGAVLAQANALASRGDPDGSSGYLTSAIEKGGPWTDGERDALEGARNARLLQRERLTALVPLLEAWTKARPDAEEAWRELVSARYFRGDEVGADAWVLEVLTTVGRGETFPRAERARFGAAVGMAFGQGWNWWTQNVPVSLHAPLAELAERLLLHDDARLQFAPRLWNDGRLTSTEPGRLAYERVRTALLAPGAVESLPLNRLDVLVGIVSWAKAAVDDATFERVLKALIVRATRSEYAGERALAASLAMRVVENRGENDRVLDVLRAWRDVEQGRAKDGVTRTLFDRLLASTHTAAREDEAAALMSELLPAERPEAWRLATAGNVLRAFTTSSVEGRTRALLGTPEEQAARTRAAAREAESRARKDARTAFADRLAGAKWPEDFAGWATLEIQGLHAEVGKDLADVVRAAQAVRGFELDPEGGKRLPAGHPLDAVVGTMRARAAVLLAYAVTRRGAPAGLADQALAAFEARWSDDRHDWRYETFRVLVALDRVEDLRKVLGTWTGAPDAEPRWRRALAYLEAELGHLEPAVALIEGLRGVEGALGYGDLSAYADWLLALDQDKRREEALVQRFEMLDEWRLSQRIQQETGAIQRRGPGVPTDIDPEVLPALHVLLQKAANPQNYVWVVQSLYAPTKDHRVLAGLVHGVLGHSPQGAYGFLQQLTVVVSGVHEEAALDALRAAATEAQAKATRAPDRRALGLLLALVDLRASEVLLKDPRPSQRAVAALAAAAGPLEEGELRPLVAFLGALPVSGNAALAEERARQLGLLANAADVASGERLAVVRVLAQVLWDAQRHDEALERLRAARDEAVAAADERAEVELGATIDVLVEWLATRGRFGDAATLLVDEQKRARTPLGFEGARLRLYRLWGRGLKEGAAFAIGRGEALFREAVRQIEATWASEPSLSQELHAAHAELYRAAAHAKVVPDVGTERVRFAAERLPALLKGLPPRVAGITQGEAQVLADLAGPRAAIRFLLDRSAVEPRWFVRLGSDVWPQNVWRLAEWRARGEPLGALDAPLLAYVLQHLEERLLADDTDSAAFWQHGNTWFWSVKVPEFMAVAHRAAEMAPQSASRQRVCAWTLVGMGRPREAIALLLAAADRGALDAAGREMLLDLLLEQRRFAEALVQADALLKETPEALEVHLRRARALVGLGRRPDALEALKTGLARLPGPQPPNPHVVARVAELAVEFGLHEAAVEWYQDALRRTEGGRPHLRHVRSDWRARMARSLAALGRDEEAVAAAAAAVVGTAQEPGLEREISDDDLLEKVLLELHALDGFVSGYEAKVAKEGSDAPLIRKALARVYLRRNAPAQAILQLEALRTLVPGDAVVLKVLAGLYQRAGDSARSLDALEARLRADPGATDAWEDFGRRLHAAGRADDAERAFTSAIEMRPLEPDGQRLLARVRREQRRLADAADRWHQVTRLRPLEPEGRLEEARAWIDAKEPAKATALLDEVLAGTWEGRFEPLKQEAARLRAALR